MNGNNALRRIVILLAVLVLLISSIPVASAATAMGLQIPDGTSMGTWKQVSTRRYSFKFEVKNTSPSKTVRSFDVTYYTCDGYGNQNSATETVTFTQKIKPYETVETGLLYLQNPDDVCTVHVALSRVTYTNGTTERASGSDLEYHYWILNEDLLMIDPADATSSASTTTTDDSSDALSDLLSKYSSNAKASIPLKIINDGDVICKRVSTRRYSFQFQVKNTNSSKTIRAYDVTYYTCDEYEEQNSPTETVTITQKVKPYETVMSNIVYLSNPDDVYMGYFAITRVLYTDGTSESVSTPEYAIWVWTD